jgi:hypothetical protein
MNSGSILLVEIIALAKFSGLSELGGAAVAGAMIVALKARKATVVTSGKVSTFI